MFLTLPPSPPPPAQVRILRGADLWLDDGREAGPRAGQALAIRGGRILAVGPSEALARRYPKAVAVDLPGGTLLPGLIEGHVHVGEFESLFEDADLRGAASLEEVKARMKAWCAAHPDGWARGRGWDQNLWASKAFPAAADLDEVTGGRPAYVDRVDGHAILANHAALRVAGITRDTPDPEGGRILRDGSGEPTGILLESSAVALISRKVPAPTPRQWEDRLRAGLERLRAFGFTALTDIDLTAPELAAYRRLAARGKLPLRVFAYVNTAQPRWKDLIPAEASKPSGWFQLMGAKFYMDGALGSRGARLLAPYADSPGSGIPVQSAATISEGLAFTLARSYQAAVHAIGDAGNREALDLLERAIAAHPQAPRPRIEHAQILADEDVPRFGRLGVFASMQPVHCSSDHAWTPARLGPAREHEAYRWRDLLASGATLAFGSDAPNDLPSPWEGLASAETRQDAQGDPPGGWLPAQRLTRAEALRAYTLGNARALHRPDLGVLKPGAAADLLWVPAAFLALKPGELRAQRPGRLWIAGREVPPDRLRPVP